MGWSKNWPDVRVQHQQWTCQPTTFPDSTYSRLELGSRGHMMRGILRSNIDACERFRSWPVTGRAGGQEFMPPMYRSTTRERAIGSKRHVMPSDWRNLTGTCVAAPSLKEVMS